MELTLPSFCVLFAQGITSSLSPSSSALCFVAGAAPTFSVPLSAKVTLLVVLRCCGTASQNRCGAPLAFCLLAVRCRAASLSLVAVVVLLRGHHRYQLVRTAIAVPFWPSVCAGVVTIAGGEPWSAMGFLSDENAPCRGRLRQSSCSINTNHPLITVNQCLVIMDVLNQALCATDKCARVFRPPGALSVYVSHMSLTCGPCAH